MTSFLETLFFSHALLLNYQLTTMRNQLLFIGKNNVWMLTLWQVFSRKIKTSLTFLLSASNLDPIRNVSVFCISLKMSSFYLTPSRGSCLLFVVSRHCFGSDDGWKLNSKSFPGQAAQETLRRCSRVHRSTDEYFVVVPIVLPLAPWIALFREQRLLSRQTLCRPFL